ncbi:MAG: helix-turn-helix domain-containing protein [Clostridia bacterium]|nr:helix-turn-helix domain-containing protein [Clostridia bacterium]
MNDERFPFKMYSAQGEGRLINSRLSYGCMEIVEVISGSVRAFIGTEQARAEAGEFLYVPPSLVFRLESEDGAASVRGIIFDSFILETNMQSYESEILYMFDVQSKSRLAVFGEGHPVYETLAIYMQESYDEYVLKDVCYNLPVRANIYLMMTALLRHYCGSKSESDRLVYHNVVRLRPVIEYIDAHFSDKLYIDALADMIGVSADYFTKMFKDSIGKTPIDYINSLRVNKAMQLLSDTDSSMAEISDTVGFCNANYFHKIFKQYRDTSPLAYRKSTK